LVLRSRPVSLDLGAICAEISRTRWYNLQVIALFHLKRLAAIVAEALDPEAGLSNSVGTIWEAIRASRVFVLRDSAFVEGIGTLEGDKVSAAYTLGVLRQAEEVAAARIAAACKSSTRGWHSL
jgi:hypothetical protein